jgi:putative addiction module component (TIGR02574 family)
VEHFTSLEVERAWLDEADRRWREIETGKVQGLAGEDVMKRAREPLTR